MMDEAECSLHAEDAELTGLVEKKSFQQMHPSRLPKFLDAHESSYDNCPAKNTKRQTETCAVKQIIALVYLHQHPSVYTHIL
jgi:hypothetical protein